MRRFVIVMFMLSLVVAGVVSYYASSDPDGLERVSEDAGFSHRAEDPSVEIMPDYTVPGLRGAASNAVAGIAGVIAVFAVAWFAGMVIARAGSREP